MLIVQYTNHLYITECNNVPYKAIAVSRSQTIFPFRKPDHSPTRDTL